MPIFAQFSQFKPSSICYLVLTWPLGDAEGANVRSENQHESAVYFYIASPCWMLPLFHLRVLRQWRSSDFLPPFTVPRRCPPLRSETPRIGRVVFIFPGVLHLAYILLDRRWRFLQTCEARWISSGDRVFDIPADMHQTWYCVSGLLSMFSNASPCFSGIGRNTAERWRFGVVLKVLKALLTLVLQILLRAIFTVVMITVLTVFFISRLLTGLTVSLIL